MEKPKARPLPRRPATNQRHALPPKRRGEIAELAFMQKAVSLGFGVAKPWGDSDRYDYILDAGRRFWRVQVRSTAYESHRGYAVHTYVYVKRKMVALTADDIDCIIAYIVPARSLVRAPGRVLFALQKSVVLSQRQQKRIALRKLSRSLVAPRPGAQRSRHGAIACHRPCGDGSEPALSVVEGRPFLRGPCHSTADRSAKQNLCPPAASSYYLMNCSTKLSPSPVAAKCRRHRSIFVNTSS